jgi:hypothetical protein
MSAPPVDMFFEPKFKVFNMIAFVSRHGKVGLTELYFDVVDLFWISSIR